MGNSPNAVPVKKALAVYARLKNWNLVREEVLRPDGTKYTYHGLVAAVRAHDKQVSPCR